jgi:hypothetical protein
MKELIISIEILIGLLLSLFLAFGLVPLLVELAVRFNWSELGAGNRWFYFFYFLTVPIFLDLMIDIKETTEKY